MIKIVVLSSELLEIHKKRIRETADQIRARVCFAESEDQIPVEFEDAQILYGYGGQFPSKNRNLKWICSPAAGVERLLQPGVFANEDCMITNSAGAFGVSIAEHIIMVSLMLLRQMTVIYPKSVSGEWGDRLWQKSLKDCRITVLGTGDIGCCFARRVKAFEPGQLVGICRSGSCQEPAFDRIRKPDELDGILPETDLLVMCLPDTPQTRGILSKERIGLLARGAYVVNVGRGNAIDEAALADSLETGRLGGAALDVFTKEPLPGESRLWKLPNLIITPHVAGNMTLAYTMDKNVQMFCEDLLNYAANRPLSYLVDKKLGY
ncbi:MAG: D-2-hydroxyacid dehydrogenase [Lachnospiraceae bacterium]|nr:D-2-hydroxyacid dehydrogenase [Lachnospiraceae bacterium]